MKKTMNTVIVMILVMTLVLTGCATSTVNTTNTAASTTSGASSTTGPDGSQPVTSNGQTTGNNTASNGTATKNTSTGGNTATKAPVTTTPGATTAAPTNTFFVDAKNGSDSNDGSINKPFKTIKKAKEHVRTLLPAMKTDIVINLRAGTYYLDSTLEFTSADSGQNGHKVIYRSYDSQRAIISGGTQITGWTLYDSAKNIWKASAKGVDSRTLFVNNKRATRARTALAELKNDPTIGKMWTDASQIVKQIAPYANCFTSTDMKWASFKRQSDMEMVFVWCWHSPRVPIKSITAKSGYVVFQTTDLAWSILYGLREHAYGTNFVPADSLYYIENAYELLDEAGEWYLNDDTDTVYYKPRSGENMSSADAVMGRLEHLVSGIGTRTAPISNITFDSVDFMHTTWDQGQKEEGWIDIQAGFYKGDGKKISTTAGIRPSAALEFAYTRYINIINCSVMHVGNAGIDFSTSTQNVVIQGNHIADCSSNGIMLGGHSDTVDFQPRASQLDLVMSKDNQIVDNYIHNIAAEYHDGCAIVRGYTYNTAVSYNTIKDVPYTGLSIGWGWGHGEGDRNQTTTTFPYGVFSGNSVKNNHISNTNWMLADGGGIYTLGRQDNMIIEGNYILKSGEQGIYLDNGSGNMTVQYNVLKNVVRNFVVRGHDNTLKLNYIEAAPYADGIQPEFGGVFHIDYTNCSTAKRDSIIKAAGTRKDYTSFTTK